MVGKGVSILNVVMSNVTGQYNGYIRKRFLYVKSRPKKDFFLSYPSPFTTCTFTFFLAVTLIYRAREQIAIGIYDRKCYKYLHSIRMSRHVQWVRTLNTVPSTWLQPPLQSRAKRTSLILGLLVCVPTMLLSIWKFRALFSWETRSMF